MANHLGNVLETISDRKLAIDDNTDNLVDVYTADVSSFSDYLPFGSLMPGRNGGNTSRFGFQGQERDDELKGKGNSWNYKYRMHDARIGRFFALDPLAPYYPHNSPYAFSENRVIDWIELEGLEGLTPTMTKDESKLKVENIYSAPQYSCRGCPSTRKLKYQKITHYWTNSSGNTESKSILWNPNQSKYRYGIYNLNKVGEVISLGQHIQPRPHPLTKNPAPEAVQGNNNVYSQFNLLLGNQGADNRPENKEYGKLFRHLLYQGLLTSIYGADEAEELGNGFEGGRVGTYNRTANPGLQSYGDIINNAFGRQFFEEYNGDISTIDGFVNYLNFLGQKVVEADKQNLNNASVTFTKDTPGVQQIFDEYQRLKTANTDENEGDDD